MKQFLILLLLTLQLAAHAQTKKIKVFDADTKEPLAGASVKINNQLFITAADGSFNTGNSNTPIEISMLGYKTVTVPTTATAIALEKNNNSLQEIIVTASREASLRRQAPVAIHKVSAKMLEETKPTAIYEAINKVPGVMMQNYNNEQHGMAIRQPMGTANYYLYMEDGVPIRPMGVFNHNALLEVNQYTTSAIEVVKGPVSSIYGPEAVGGAINFITQRPTAIPTARVGIQFDQFGYRRVQTGMGNTFGKFGIYVGGIYSKQTNSWMANSDYDKSSWTAKMEYQFSNRTRLTASLLYARYFSNTAGSVDSQAFYTRTYVSPTDFTYRKSTASRNRLTLEHDWNKNAKSFITFFHRYNAHGQNPSYAIRWTTGQTTARGEINSNNFKSYGVLTQHSQQLNFLNAKLLAGAMFDYSPNEYWSYQVDLNAQLRPDGKSVEKYTINKERPDIPLANYAAKIRNSAAYTQFEIEPLKAVRVVAGLRYDRMSFTYDNFLDKTAGSKKYEQLTPKLGITYTVNSNAGVYANFLQGFAPPSLTAIFRKKPNSNPAEFYYNLTPGQFNNYEVGGWASFWKNKLYVDVSVYQMNGKNELLNIRQPDNSFDYQSAGKTLHRGIEYGFTFKPTNQYSLRFGGTTAVHRFVDFLVSAKETDVVKKLDGFDMPAAPRTVFNTELSYYPKWLKGLRTSAEWQHVDGWYQNQVNTVRYKGYVLLNFRIGYQWKGVELYSNIMNLTDALYATGATRGNAATDRTTFTPAAPRTFVFGLQYSFSGNQ
ncbi:MAG TPA: TonB-dependent receptor [Ferruginibacter sp.]|nr:TonB-dependent receptor [Ferruginibacter sp.]HMP19364.1 TonB-dependent receptor [Ferruginibacter sp.]